MAQREKNPPAVALASVEIVPLGTVRHDVLERLAMRLRGAFDSRVVIAAPAAVPQAAWQSNRGQYNTLMILNAVRPVVWEKGWKRLGVIDADLFSGNLNFVFGQADISGSTAVVSLARLRNEFYALPADDALLVERAAKEAVHEIGHTLGLAHCKDRGCVMYFSNSLVDTDRKGAAFCDECGGRIDSGGGK
jgi:archaemetzincin